jgi:hypothetical protein
MPNTGYYGYAPSKDVGTILCESLLKIRAEQGQRRNTMTTGEAQRTIAYQGIVENLLALRDEARDGNEGDNKAINRILASIMSLQLIDRFSRMPIAGTRKSIEPVLLGTTGGASKKAPSLLTEKPPRVLPLAELLPN